jgi:hypothetical protein
MIAHNIRRNETSRLTYGTVSFSSVSAMGTDSRINQEYYNLYNVFTAKAIAKSTAIISGVLIATVPHVFACFSWSLFLYVFPHWAMTILFICGGSICAIGIYILLKSLLIPTANHRNTDMEETPLSVNAGAVSAALLISPANHRNTDTEEALLSVNAGAVSADNAPLRFIVGKSTEIAAMTNAFLNTRVAKVYIGNAVKILHILTTFGCPLILNREIMENLHVCNNGICDDNQFYGGKFYAPRIIVDSLPHILSDNRIHSYIERRVSIEYRNCDFRSMRIQEEQILTDRNPINYSFCNCTITSDALKLMKNSDVYFDNFKFEGIESDIDYRLQQVHFVGQGKNWNEDILNISGNAHAIVTFENYHITQNILNVNFRNKSTRFCFKNCSIEGGLAQEIGSTEHDASYYNCILARLPRNKQLPAIKEFAFNKNSIFYEDMEINEDTFAAIKCLRTTVEIKRCTFNFTQNADTDWQGLCFSSVEIIECEICDKVFEIFSIGNIMGSIKFSFCNFLPLTISISSKYDWVCISNCIGTEYMLNILKDHVLTLWIKTCTLDSDKMDEDALAGYQDVTLHNVTFKECDKPFPMLHHGLGKMKIEFSKNSPCKYGIVKCESVEFFRDAISDSSVQSLQGEVGGISISSCNSEVSLTLPKELKITNYLTFINIEQCEKIYIGDPTKIQIISICQCENLKEIETPEGICPVVNRILQFKKEKNWFEKLIPERISIYNCFNLADEGRVSPED